MAEPVPAAAAAQQQVVSPETTHESPAPAASSTQQESTVPEAPATTRAPPVRASQPPPNMVGMHAATLYAEPVDPAKPTEDVGWKWVKLGLVVIALLVALSALGLSLSFLRFPKALDITRSYAFIGSTVPLVSSKIYLIKYRCCNMHSNQTASMPWSSFGVRPNSLRAYRQRAKGAPIPTQLLPCGCLYGYLPWESSLRGQS